MRALVLVLVLVLAVSILGCRSSTKVGPGATESASQRDAGLVPPSADDAKARLLRSQARTAYQQKDFAGCVERYEQAKGIAPETADEAYGEACCASLAGDADRAFALLNVAASKGYRSRAHLEADPDLNALKVKADSRWPALVAKVQANLDEWGKSNSLELLELYDADQADRMGDTTHADWQAISKRDRDRRAQVFRILSANGAKSSDDYYHAAMIFQHGQELSDFKACNDLARKAVELNPSNKSARWLAAASEDRWLMNRGLPQKYGTQFRMSQDGKWQLYQVDPNVTDEQRAEWNVPPLAEAKKREAAMNAGR